MNKGKPLTVKLQRDAAREGRCFWCSERLYAPLYYVELERMTPLVPMHEGCYKPWRAATKQGQGSLL